MKIALTHTENPEKHQFYIKWLRANEDIEIIPVSVDNNNLDEIKQCDALVLSGGIDIHPKYYGSDMTGYPNAPARYKEERDEFEIAAFHLAQENNLPVLGICRGMQLINVIHKGTLIQNLDDDTLNEIHKGEPDKTHAVHVEKGTILYDIAGAEIRPINSAHHQAVDRLGEGLIVNALSDDGIIEGIERKDKANNAFLLAIQWHPERMFRFQLEDTALSMNIRNRFIEEIKKSIAGKK
jgi:putative glutamine amidotransferase